MKQPPVIRIRRRAMPIGPLKFTSNSTHLSDVIDRVHSSVWCHQQRSDLSDPSSSQPLITPDPHTHMCTHTNTHTQTHTHMWRDIRKKIVCECLCVGLCVCVSLSLCLSPAWPVWSSNPGLLSCSRGRGYTCDSQSNRGRNVYQPITQGTLLWLSNKHGYTGQVSE